MYYTKASLYGAVHYFPWDSTFYIDTTRPDKLTLQYILKTKIKRKIL